MERKKGSVDHELDGALQGVRERASCRRSEPLRLLAQFSEREIEAGTGVHRSRIRLLRHGGTVTRKTYEKIQSFLQATAVTSE